MGDEFRREQQHMEGPEMGLWMGGTFRQDITLISHSYNIGIMDHLSIAFHLPLPLDYRCLRMRGHTVSILASQGPTTAPRM